MWEILDKALVMCGFESIFNKIKAPGVVVLMLAYVFEFIGKITGKQFS